MLYFFTGDDSKKKNEAYEKFVNSIQKGIEVLQINKNDFEETQFESLYSGAGLFFSRSTVLLRGVFENETARDFILKKIDLIRDSSNDFVFLESKQNKPVIDIFKKAGAEIYNFELPKEKKEKFNNFLLANALGDRDKLNLWIYFRMAIDKGVGMEELIGVLFWKAKDMLVKKNFGKFSQVELQSFVGKISYLLPESRKKGLDDESAFEKFLLEAF